MPQISPSGIQRVYIHGNGDIDAIVEPPFEGGFVLVYVRAHFVDIRSAAGASKTAAFTIDLDHNDPGRATDVHDVRIWYEAVVGLDDDLFWRIPDEEAAGYTFGPDDRLKFAWTNPSAAEIGWALEVGFSPLF